MKKRKVGRPKGSKKQLNVYERLEVVEKNVKKLNGIKADVKKLKQQIYGASE